VGAKGVRLKESADLDDATIAAISEVSSAGGVLKIKFHGKTDAIDKIAKILRWYDNDVKTATQINVVVSPKEL
jgi:hypothetical protein